MKRVLVYQTWYTNRQVLESPEKYFWRRVVACFTGTILNALPALLLCWRRSRMIRSCVLLFLCSFFFFHSFVISLFFHFVVFLLFCFFLSSFFIVVLLLLLLLLFLLLLLLLLLLCFCCYVLSGFLLSFQLIVR